MLKLGFWRLLSERFSRGDLLCLKVSPLLMRLEPIMGCFFDSRTITRAKEAAQGTGVKEN